MCSRRGLGLAAIAPLGAHHAIAAKFDPAKSTTLTGLVTKVDWANPHVHVLMNVVTGGRDGELGGRTREPPRFGAQRLDMDSVKPGESVTVQGILARDGSAAGVGQLDRPDGLRKRKCWRVARGAGGVETGRRQSPAPPAPRWPDGKPRLGAAARRNGILGQAELHRADGSRAPNVEMDGNGLLKNLKDSGKVAPFQPWAKALYELRQRNFLNGDPMYLTCKPAGRGAAVSDAVRQSVSRRQDVRADLRHGRRRQS